MSVPEERGDVRILKRAAILKEKLILLFAENVSERLYTANSRVWGRPRT